MIEKVVAKKLMNIVYDEKCNTEEPQQTEIKIVREKGLDKFYTIPTYSKKCIDKICELYDIKKWDLIVEPSAGNGSFLNQIPSNNKIRY